MRAVSQQKLSDSGNAVRKNKENSRIAQQNLGGYQPVVSYTPFQPTNQPTHQPATGGTAQQPRQAPVVGRPSKTASKVVRITAQRDLIVSAA